MAYFSCPQVGNDKMLSTKLCLSINQWSFLKHVLFVKFGRKLAPYIQGHLLQDLERQTLGNQEQIPLKSRVTGGGPQCSSDADDTDHNYLCDQCICFYVSLVLPCNVSGSDEWRSLFDGNIALLPQIYWELSVQCVGLVAMLTCVPCTLVVCVRHSQLWSLLPTPPKVDAPWSFSNRPAETKAF